MKKNIFSSSNIMLLGLGAFLLVGLITFTRKYQLKPTPSSSTVLGSSVIPSSNNRQDLGVIPMSKGIKKLAFAYKNETNKPLKLSNLYTTCMCTKARLKSGDKETVFAGMKGHTAGLMPINPNMILEPDQEMIIEVEFDPNAHGPAGIGPITRSVIVETDGKQLEFMFNGTVTR